MMAGSLLENSWMKRHHWKKFSRLWIRMEMAPLQNRSQSNEDSKVSFNL